ncbi:MAG: DUF502 domain-containing protein [Chitinophagales bacterium]
MSNLPAKRYDKINNNSENIGKQLVSYFLQGLVLIAPFVVTFYILYQLFIYIDNIIDLGIPGLSMLIILTSITAIGYFSKTYLLAPFFEYLAKIMTKLPLAKIIYTSLQDLFSAFMGDEQKFDTPVLVILNKQSKLKKMGFITQTDMSNFGLEEEVAVYFPHSYNFSGNLFIIPKENVILLKDINASDAMKFIVSGGVTSVSKKANIVQKDKEENSTF